MMMNEIALNDLQTAMGRYREALLQINDACRRIAGVPQAPDVAPRLNPPLTLRPLPPRPRRGRKPKTVNPAARKAPETHSRAEVMKNGSIGLAVNELLPQFKHEWFSTDDMKAAVVQRNPALKSKLGDVCVRLIGAYSAGKLESQGKGRERQYRVPSTKQERYEEFRGTIVVPRDPEVNA
jgi:hypothetical protein